MGCLSDRKDAQKVTSLHMTDMSQSPRTQMIASVKQDASVNIFKYNKRSNALFVSSFSLFTVRSIQKIHISHLCDFNHLNCY